MKSRGQKMKLAIVINTETNGSFGEPYFHIYGDPVHRDENGNVRGFSGSYSPINGVASFDNLRITSQGQLSEGRMYAFEVRYQNAYAIEERDAEKMWKSLRTINARIRKINEKRGHTNSYGEFMVRVAEAIGAVEILFATRTGGSFHREMEYQSYSLEGGRVAIEKLIELWKERKGHVSPADISKETVVQGVMESYGVA